MIWLFLNNPECLHSERSTDKINLRQTLPLAISMLKLMRVRDFSSTSAKVLDVTCICSQCNVKKNVKKGTSYL